MKKLSLIIAMLLTTCFAQLSLAAVASNGSGYSKLLDNAVVEACRSAALKQTVCPAGFKFITTQTQFDRCLQETYCLNLREPNIPYSEDEYSCSATIYGVCRKY